MRIYIDRYFNFFTHSAQGWIEVEFEEPARLCDILGQVGIPQAEVFLAVVNGEAVDPCEIFITRLDKVKVFPPFGGG